jgi:hypothetical protein
VRYSVPAHSPGPWAGGSAPRCRKELSKNKQKIGNLEAEVKASKSLHLTVILPLIDPYLTFISPLLKT